MTPGKSGALALLLAAAVVLVFVLGVRKDMTDFGVCYRAGGRALNGEDLYRPSDGHLQFKYSPAAALFYIPISVLPWGAAKAVWYALEILFLSGIFIASLRLLPSLKTRPALLGVWSFLVLGKLLGREIQLGQVNLLIIFLLSLMALALQEKRDFLAGLLGAASLFFKPYALVFLPYFLLKKRFRTLPGLGVTLLFGGLAPALVFGWSGNLKALGEWGRTLGISTPSLLAAGDNASLHGLIRKDLPGLGSSGIQQILGLCLAVLASLFLWMMFWGKRFSLPKAETAEIAFLLVLIPLFSPLGWYYNYLYGFLALLLCIDMFRRLPLVARIVLLANLALIGASLREVLGKAGFDLFRAYSLVTINFLILLGFLFYGRMKKLI
jgi:hypothetical protein